MPALRALQTHHLGTGVRDVLEVAEHYHLAAYDFMYIALAGRLRCSLAVHLLKRRSSAGAD